MAKELNAEILVTTSRRTPAYVENFLYKELKKDPVCPLLVIPNQQDIPEAFGGIVALSDVLIVSGDSISMVSEAATSGKQTIVFLPETRTKNFDVDLKHYRFLEQLNTQGYIVATKIPNIGRCIYDVVKGKLQTKRLDDNITILEAARKVI